MFNGCGGCNDLFLLLLLCCCGGDCGCKRGYDCRDIIMLYALMSCCGKDKCCC